MQPPYTASLLWRSMSVARTRVCISHSAISSHALVCIFWLFGIFELSKSLIESFALSITNNVVRNVLPNRIHTMAVDVQRQFDNNNNRFATKTERATKHVSSTQSSKLHIHRDPNTDNAHTKPKPGDITTSERSPLRRTSHTAALGSFVSP